MRRLAALAAIALAAGLVPAVAEAHLVITGMGPIYDGATHFGLSPEDILPVLALAAFAGLRGPRAARLSLAALTLSWFVCGVAAAALGLAPPAIWLGLTTAAVLLVSGALLASNLGLSPQICAIAAGLLGLSRGVADLGVRPGDDYGFNALGMTVAAGTLFALAASLTLPLKRLWMIVAARVMGSWVAAVGLLLVGWIARYGAGVA